MVFEGDLFLPPLCSHLLWSHGVVSGVGVHYLVENHTGHGLRVKPLRVRSPLHLGCRGAWHCCMANVHCES